MDLRSGYQTDAKTGVYEQLRCHRSTLLVLPTGCHEPEQRVLRHDGTSIEAQHVRTGDLLMGPDGVPREVVRLRNGEAPMVRIRPVKGEPWIVTADHKLTLVRTQTNRPARYPCQIGGGLLDVPVCEWAEWSKWAKHTHKLIRTGVDFPSPDYRAMPIAPYLLGVLLGDGTLANRVVEVTTADDEIVDELRHAAQSWGLDLRSHDANAGKALGWRLCVHVRGRGRRNPIQQHLAAMGLSPVRCEDRFVPEPYRLGARDDRLEMLAGLMDTDGHARQGGYEFVSKSHALADAVVFMARSVGLAAYHSDKIVDGARFSRVSISGDCAIIPCRVSRKQHDERRQKKDVLRTGFSVEPVGRREYFGWTVAGADGRYLLDDFTITHNCGKTIVFAHMAAEGARNGRRTLILAHREELVLQAVDKLHTATGVRAAVEMAQRKEGLKPRGELFGEGESESIEILPAVVVASVQSMVRRLDRFARDHFDLIVVDEGHHTPAKTYQQILSHFSDAKVVGVTATPDRGDKVALREAFDSVAYTYEIKDAIKDGWLVPVRQLYVETDTLDLRKCRTTAGDLNQGDLDAIMSEASMLHEVAGPTVELAEDRPTLIFTVTVRHAHLLAAVLREHVKDRARKLGRSEPPDSVVAALDGTSNKEERAAVVAAFQRGDVQYLCNCALFTEGFDAPPTAVVVMGRPTKSRALYAQMLGRGTRPLTGLVDGVPDAELRRAAVAGSVKPDLLVLDFAGNSGKHSLVNAVDVLDGEASEPEQALARGMLERGEIQDVLEALARAREQIAEMERRRFREQARRGHRTVAIDPFQALGVTNPGEDSWGRTVTEKQTAFLDKKGIKSEGMSRRQASSLIGRLIERQDGDKATYKQVNRLIKTGLDPEVVWEMSFRGASDLITELVRNKWKRPASWDERFGRRA